MKWDNSALVTDVLKPIIYDLQLNERTRIRIVDSSGDMLLGEPGSTTDILTVFDMFDDFEHRGNVFMQSVERLLSEVSLS